MSKVNEQVNTRVSLFYWMQRIHYISIVSSYRLSETEKIHSKLWISIMHPVPRSSSIGITHTHTHTQVLLPVFLPMCGNFY